MWGTTDLRLLHFLRNENEFCMVKSLVDSVFDVRFQRRVAPCFLSKVCETIRSSNVSFVFPPHTNGQVQVAAYTALISKLRPMTVKKLDTPFFSISLAIFLMVFISASDIRAGHALLFSGGLLGAVLVLRRATGPHWSTRNSTFAGAFHGG